LSNSIAMLLSFFDIVHSIIFFQLTILIVVLLVKGWTRISNRLLAFFLFVQMVASLNAIYWNHYQPSATSINYLGYLVQPFFFTWGPTMYLFITSQINTSFKLNVKHLLHYIPSISLMFYFLVAFSIIPTIHRNEPIQNFRIIPEVILQNLDLMVIIQVAIYNITAIFNLERFLKNKTSGDRRFNEIMNWNKFILYGYFFACIIYDIYRFTSPLFMSGNTIMNISFISFLIYFIAILYKSIVSNIFSSEKIQVKKRNLLLPENQLEDLTTELELIMMTEKPFLNFNYGLKEMTQRMNVSERLLSQAINESREQNVNDFINNYRIEEAKKIITENSDPKKTFLEIAFESGFNSKSAFYLVFKKRTGITPTEFKNSISYNTRKN